MMSKKLKFINIYHCHNIFYLEHHKKICQTYLILQSSVRLAILSVLLPQNTVIQCGSHYFVLDTLVVDCVVLVENGVHVYSFELVYASY